ncbi:molecular chaperone DnaJ [Patescibacteria group bacterium]|nr:MAG: molecular chaperone DnaJ [Patescibacteria group bacterium]
MAKDYYKILGIDKNASPEEIKKAFKKLALEHHPDRPGGNEAKFKEINEAYQVLGDAEKRQRYDQFGADFEQQGGFGGASWEDFMRAARGQNGFSNGGFSFNFGDLDLGDIFGDVFGAGRSRRGGRERGQDIQIDAQIDFKEAAFGVEKTFSLRKKSQCDVCGGSGAEPGSKMETCKTCGGQGQVVRQQSSFFGMVQTVGACPDCGGRGQKPGKKCKHCGGSGALAKTSDINVKIPAGIDDGQAIRLAGYGEAGEHGGQAGDLFVRVRVKPLKGFERDSDDVYTESEISFVQAALGDNISVETLDGLLTIVVPAGTEHGQMIRLKGRGIERINRGGRGDHFVKIKIRVPKKLSRSARKLLDDLRGEL